MKAESSTEGEDGDRGGGCMTLNVQIKELEDGCCVAPLGLLEVTRHEVNLSLLTYFYSFL